MKSLFHFPRTAPLPGSLSSLRQGRKGPSFRPALKTVFFCAAAAALVLLICACSAGSLPPADAPGKPVSADTGRLSSGEPAAGEEPVSALPYRPAAVSPEASSDEGIVSLQEPPVSLDELMAAAGGMSCPYIGETDDLRDFLLWCASLDGCGDLYLRLFDALQNGDDFTVLPELTGRSAHVLHDLYALYTGAAESTPRLRILNEAGGLNAVLTFAGDVNFADDWLHAMNCAASENTILDCIGDSLVQELRQSDIAMVNNEFTFSTRGSPLWGKQYTLRADPAKVSYYEQLGIDIVSLANNHSCDFGAYAFYDTLDTLSGAGIDAVGAGKNLSAAGEIQYYIVNGIKIAYIAATRAEKRIFTPDARQSRYGVFYAYDPEPVCARIREAREQADYVIAYLHWGTENSYTLEDEQMRDARLYIDAGADIVIGSHAHCLQGVEFYEGKPIIYNLGNFWFNMKKCETALLKVSITRSSIQCRLIPCLQNEGRTDEITGTEAGSRLTELMEIISVNTVVSSDGTLSPR